MRTNRRPTPLLFSLAWLLPLLLPLLIAARPASSPVPLAPRQDSHSEFRNAFKQAMDLGATAEMERLIKKHNPEAISWIMDTAEGISYKSSEELETRMDAFRKAWRGGMDSDFCDNMYEYFSLLEPVLKRERSELKAKYDKVNRDYWNNVTKKDHSTFGLISGKLRGMADVFVQLGDYYFASQCWLLDSSCWSEANRGSKSDLYKVYEACAKVCEYRDKIDLNDRSYSEAKVSRDYLKSQGYDGETGEEGGEPGTGPPKGGIKAAGSVITAPMTFEMVEDLSAFERPCYYADALYNMWNPLAFKGKGSVAVVNSLGELSPKVYRVGSAEVLLDADGDGKGEVKVPLRGNLDPVEFTLGEGDEKRPWGVLTQIGTQKDVYQGIQMNMIPDDNQMQIYLAPGASMVGEFEGVPIRVFDDNMDGVYGSSPLSWEHIGMTPGNLHPELDSVVIGDRADRALPWSEYQKIGDKWYMMAPAKNGTLMTGSPVEVETGKVKLTFKGGKPQYVVLKGSGLYENSYFDVVDKKTELPAGDYTLFYGELRKGKKQQMKKTLIIPGKNTRKWTVEVGGTTKIELGAPFGFDFDFDSNDKGITVEGHTVAIVGMAGERYERPWNCVAHPEASWRKAGSKRGSKGEDMGYVKGQEEISKVGWKGAWFPFSITMVKKGQAKDVEVQLFEKKNKLFGKIESGWKE
jgi:hypothetical protein